MPSKSPEQARLMGAVAHGWKMPGGGGPSQEVAEEFNEADSENSEPKDPTLSALDEIRSLCDQVEMDLAKKKKPPPELPAASPEEEA